MKDYTTRYKNIYFSGENAGYTANGYSYGKGYMYGMFATKEEAIKRLEQDISNPIFGYLPKGGMTIRLKDGAQVYYLEA